MRVAVLREGRLVVLDNEPWPVVRSGELLVRVIAAGCTLPEPEVRVSRCHRSACSRTQSERQTHALKSEQETHLL